MKSAGPQLSVKVFLRNQPCKLKVKATRKYAFMQQTIDGSSCFTCRLSLKVGLLDGSRGGLACGHRFLTCGLSLLERPLCCLECPVIASLRLGVLAKTRCEYYGKR